VASLDGLLSKGIRMGKEQMDAEVVETVAGVARLLRRGAELAWTQADVAGPRSSRQLLALGIDSAADEASSLLPRRARLDGPTPVGDNPAELLASAEQLLRRICVVGAPSRLFGLRVLVAELVWEANTGAGK
jgi:hypothetical protein